MSDFVFQNLAWLKPSAGLPAVQWALLLALAALSGHALQRRLGLPQVLGYSLIGALAGLSGYASISWPLDGMPQFVVELGLSVVLFEAGGRLSLGWLKRNPMLLAQSVAETGVTYLVALGVLRLFSPALTAPDWSPSVHAPLALLLTAASPAVLLRVAHEQHASGPVTDRALALATLNTFYVLALGSVMARVMGATPAPSTQGLAVTANPHWLEALLAWLPKLLSVALLVLTSVIVGALLALALRKVLGWMSPVRKNGENGENAAVVQLALIAIGTALAAQFGGSAPLAALLAGVLLKAWHPRPWLWPRQFGTAASMLGMLMFMLVSMAAAQGFAQGPTQGLGTFSWSLLALLVALLLARTLARLGVLGATALPGVSGISGTSAPQALWLTLALGPMSATALLLVSQFAEFAPELGAPMGRIALPLILVQELLGALMVMLALRLARESSHAH